MIMISRMKASTKMKVSPDQISQYTGDQIDYEDLKLEALNRAKITRRTSEKTEFRDKVMNTSSQQHSNQRRKGIGYGQIEV